MRRPLTGSQDLVRVARAGLRPPRERGAALVVGLVLLAILTLLAFAGANTASTELVMAGNEQYRRNASLAAQAGIEQAISQLADVPTSTAADPTRADDLPVADSDIDSVSTATRYVGAENGLPQLSADKFVGLHYVIESTGRSARNANDLQRQGVFVVAAAGNAGESTFRRLGAGLE